MLKLSDKIQKLIKVMSMSCLLVWKCVRPFETFKYFQKILPWKDPVQPRRTDGKVGRVFSPCILTLNKNKPARNDYNNYRRISLFSVIGKLISSAVLARLQLLANRIYMESQCSLRAGRSAFDMMLSIRQL